MLELGVYVGRGTAHVLAHIGEYLSVWGHYHRATAMQVVVHRIRRFRNEAVATERDKLRLGADDICGFTALIAGDQYNIWLLRCQKLYLLVKVNIIARQETKAYAVKLAYAFTAAVGYSKIYIGGRQVDLIIYKGNFSVTVKQIRAVFELSVAFFKNVYRYVRGFALCDNRCFFVDFIRYKILRISIFGK